MQTQNSTQTSAPNGVRRAFGSELLTLAMRRMPAMPDNAQRDDFLKAKPCVFDTLERFLDAEIRAGCTQEQYDELVFSLYMSMLNKWAERAGHPKERLSEACALDEAAEGLEDVAEITAVAEPSLGNLTSLWQRMLASMSAKRRALRVIQRDFNKAMAR